MHAQELKMIELDVFIWKHRNFDHNIELHETAFLIAIVVYTGT